MDIKKTVPDIDLNAELPVLENPVEDVVMINVKQEWRKGLIIFSVFVIILAATVWAFILNNQIVSETSKSVNQDVSSSAMPVASLMPEASVKPVFAIFNGSGVPGAAAKLKTKIQAAGYEVVEVGNMDKSQTGMTVEIGSLVSNQKDEILQVIGTNEYIPLRDNNLKYSVKIIIGK